jgi:hypothetical protein
MRLENIRYKHFEEPDRMEVQRHAIEAATQDPGRIIGEYRQDPRSFDGRYVAADLFKEMFAEYRESAESRNRYNNAVHNSAAVLASALYGENLSAPREEGRGTVYLLSGSPGAGKTSMVLKQNVLPADALMVYEGQLSNFDTSREKIERAIAAGARPHIIVVHARSEEARDNTLRRYYEEGRGSSIATIAQIQGGLPDSIQQLATQFGNALMLDIIDVRDRANPVHLRGFDNIDVLRSEGTNEHIKQRLQARIDELRDGNRISDGAYRQAAGQAPGQRVNVDRERDPRNPGNERERVSAQGSRESAVLSADGASSVRGVQRQQSALRITDSKLAQGKVAGQVIEITDTHVLVQTGRNDAVRFARSELSGAVRNGQRIELEFKAADQQHAHQQSKQSVDQSRQREIQQVRSHKQGFDGP